VIKIIDIKSPNSSLKSSLIHFLDAIDFLEAEQDIRRTYSIHTYGLEDSIDTIESFLSSDYDLIEVRDFVEYEMNRAIGDPSGKKQLEWIRSALELEKKIFLELKSR
jgi:hypothetical protein